MASPYQNFPTIADWNNWINQNILPNGNNEIDGVDGNVSIQGAVKFTTEAPINWDKADIHSTGGALVLSKGITVVIGTTPTSISWGDNRYYQWYIVNTTANNIPLTGVVYYDTSLVAQNSIPANSILQVAKADNDLWVQVSGGTGNSGGGGKAPAQYVVGTTPNAPTAGTSTWQLGVFQNSYVVLFLNRTLVDLADAGDGNSYITKPLSSDTLTINGYQWSNGDVLLYMLTTP